MQRIKFTEVVSSIDFEMSVHDIIETLKGYQKIYSSADLYVEKDYYDRHSDDHCYYIKYKRDETDEEFEKRKKLAEKFEVERADKERKEYERLKKKFG